MGSGRGPALAPAGLIRELETGDCHCDGVLALPMPDPHPCGAPGCTHDDRGDIHMALTDDPGDPRLTHGTDATPRDQAEVYLVLSEEERAKGFVRPLRRSYTHTLGCGGSTRMGLALCETYARDPAFYGATFCTGCQMHKPVHEFTWDEDGQQVGS